MEEKGVVTGLHEIIGLSPWLSGKESAHSAGDAGSIPGLGRSPGGGNGNSLQYLAWEIPRTEEPGRIQSMVSQRTGHD